MDDTPSITAGPRAAEWARQLTLWEDDEVAATLARSPERRHPPSANRALRAARPLKRVDHHRSHAHTPADLEGLAASR